MKNTPFLDFYYKWIGSEKNVYGLCNHLSDEMLSSEAWSLICPSREELESHVEDGFRRGYWGEYELGHPLSREYYGKFNEFRQNIILICAAVNGEL